MENVELGKRLFIELLEIIENIAMDGSNGEHLYIMHYAGYGLTKLLNICDLHEREEILKFLIDAYNNQDLDFSYLFIQDFIIDTYREINLKKIQYEFIESLFENSNSHPLYYGDIYLRFLKVKNYYGEDIE